MKVCETWQSRPGSPEVLHLTDNGYETLCKATVGQVLPFVKMSAWGNSDYQWCRSCHARRQAKIRQARKEMA